MCWTWNGFGSVVGTNVDFFEGPFGSHISCNKFGQCRNKTLHSFIIIGDLLKPGIDIRGMF